MKGAERRKVHSSCSVSVGIFFFFFFFAWLLRELSLAAASGGYSLVVMCGLLIMEASLVAEDKL